jgi:hypothetical protein
MINKILRGAKAAKSALARAFTQVFHDLARRFGRDRQYAIRHVPDLPPRLARGYLYVVGDADQCHYASMACPKGECKVRLNMNLLPDDHPMWKLSVDDQGRPTLHPSIWRTKDCGCHFHMRGGKLVWCK